MTPEGGKIGTHDDKYGDKNVTAGDKIDAVGRHSCARIPRYKKKNTGHHSCRQDNKNDAILPTRMWIKLTNMATNLVLGPICFVLMMRQTVNWP